MPRSTDPPGDMPTTRTCTHMKLRQLGRQVGRRYDAEVAASGLKTTQYSLLSHVVALGPVRPSDLAARMHLEPSTLTRNLQPLVKAGLVQQGPGGDARSRLVTATPEGRALRAKARKAWQQAQAALEATLGADRVARLHALIDECLELLGPAPEGPSDE